MDEPKAYRIVFESDLTYTVEISERGATPHRVTGFLTEEEAEAWIIRNRKKPEADR